MAGIADDAGPGNRSGRGALLFALVSIVAVAAWFTYAQAPGWLISDNRFDFFFDPAADLRRTWSLWDPSRDLGGTAPNWSPAVHSLSWVLATLGASPWVIQRTFHFLLLVGAGAGVIVLTRFFLGRSRMAPVVAALVYVSAPASVALFLPSWLYLKYALAPWLLWFFIRGVSGERGQGRWRWAAAFALAVLVEGTLNPPGLAWALIPLVPAAFYFVHVERKVRWRDVAAWVGRASLLVVLVLLPALLRIVWGAGVLAENLAETETVDAVSRSSSWAESLRGLGLWTIYWNPGGTPVIPRLGPHVTSLGTVLLSFALPLTAIWVVWRSRLRARLLLAGMMIVSLVAMVGVHPADDPSPFGLLLRWAYDAVPWVFGLRNTYKAAPGLMIGMAILVAVAAVAGVRALRKRRIAIRSAALVLFVTLIVGVGAPMWTGRPYDEGPRLQTIPQYYRDAASWLNQQEGETRVLVLPDAPQESYRWSGPGFQVMEALLRRPHVMHRGLSPSSADSADLVAALSSHASSESYRQGALAPIARRLGIEYVMVRNDLVWEDLGIPRPAALSNLRSDPDLERVAVFGEPGHGVVAEDDASAVALSERRVPPIEIFQIEGVSETVRAVAPTSRLLLGGNGTAWPALAADGRLGDSPVRYTARLNRNEVLEELTAGARVVITDTNRRQAGGLVSPESFTLAAAEGEGEAGDLFGRPGSQTVAAYRDATSITAGPETLFPSDPAHRPSAATDDDLQTAWLTALLTEGAGQHLTIEFKEPAELSAARLVATSGDGATRQVVSSVLEFSDGSSVPVRTFPRPDVTVSFSPRRVDWVRLRIERIAGSGGGPVGFHEIQFPDLDLRELIRMPHDLVRMAAADADLRRKMMATPVSYRFERLRAAGVDEEPSLRRAARFMGDRSYVIRGSVQLDERLDRDDISSAAREALGFELEDVANAQSNGGECIEGVISMDGDPIPVRLEGSVAALFAGRSVPFRGCGSVQVTGGWHVFESTGGLIVNEGTLDSIGGGHAPEPVSVLPVAVIARDAGNIRVRMPAEDGATIVSGQAFDARWRGVVDGRPLGEPLALDTMSAWTIAESGEVVFVMSLPQTRWYRWAMMFSGLMVVILVGLIWWDPPLAKDVTTDGTTRRVPQPAFEVVAFITGVIMAGIVGAVLSSAGIFLVRTARMRPAVLAAGAIPLLLLAAAFTVPPLGPDLVVQPGFALQRSSANAFAQAGAVLLATSAVLAAFREQVSRQDRT